ncbi:conserved hypothetical protein [delta proteobacterium NaphS2]|nr:conserved hypothetical protein [delta proteobacterium NaphS2]
MVVIASVVTHNLGFSFLNGHPLGSSISFIIFTHFLLQATHPFRDPNPFIQKRFETLVYSIITKKGPSIT